MKNKTGKVVWFTYVQVLTSKWFCMITVLGIFGVLLSTQYEKISNFLSGGKEQTALQQTENSAVGLDMTFLLQFLIVFVLFLLILIYGSNIANSIVEEKSARIIETLLCYVKPLQLLAGKILGYVCGIVTQVGIWAVYYIILNSLIDVPDSQLFSAFANLDEKAVILLAVSIILGFIMYAFAFAALAAFADNAQDSTQLMMPVGAIILVVYFISLAVMNGMKGVWIDVLSYAPFFSPIVTFVTCDLNQITWAELFLKAGVQLIEVIVIAVICSRIYRRGVISYGIRKPSIKRLFLR